jgi:hypothetical protein
MAGNVKNPLRSQHRPYRFPQKLTTTMLWFAIILMLLSLAFLCLDDHHAVKRKAREQVQRIGSAAGASKRARSRLDRMDGAPTTAPGIQKRDAKRIPIILTGETRGGTGNQIENIVEHLSIVRNQNLDGYVLPDMRSRDGEFVPFGQIWNLTLLQKVFPNIYEKPPDDCIEEAGGKIDVDYDIARENPGDYLRVIDPDSLAAKTIVVTRGREVLSPPFDLHAEVMDLLRMRSEERKQLDKDRKVACVHVSIHAAVPDWSIAPYLRLGRKYVKAASAWPLDELGFVHVRWDEIFCAEGSEKAIEENLICLRTSIPGTKQAWMSVNRYATIIQSIMRKHSITKLYVARSPYLPTVIWSHFQKTLSALENLNLVPGAAEFYEGENINYVEREIATRSRLFIGESGSSWSRTISHARGPQKATVLSDDIVRALDQLRA